MSSRDSPRLLVTLGLFILFGFVLYNNADNQMLIGAIIGSFGTAVTFWMGSSKGSSDKSEQIEKMEATGTAENPTIVEGAGPGAAPVTTTSKRRTPE